MFTREAKIFKIIEESTNLSRNQKNPCTSGLYDESKYGSYKEFRNKINLTIKFIISEYGLSGMIFIIFLIFF